jgi:hypothetical protein
MLRAVRLLALFALLTVGVATAAAQQTLPDSPPESAFVPLTPDQDRELTAWLKEMDKWQRYDAKWHNRPARDSLGRVAARKQPPDPPAWLAAHCAAAASAGMLDVEARSATACRLFDDPRARLESVPSPAQSQQIDAEKPKHSSFLTRVHLDGLWSTTQSGVRFYGLIGSHVSLVDVGRLQVFGPPGILLLSVPDAEGSRRITLGYTWGLSLRLTDVRLFGPTKDKTLFLNLSKVWIASGATEQATSRGYDIIGFSIAPRKKR